MAKVKVRHALVTYTVKRGDRTDVETAFRGMTIDISDQEVQRLMAVGAIVPEDAELIRQGQLVPLSDTPSDEEILNWVAGASEAEVVALANERPMLLTRLESAQEVIKERYKQQNELLGQAISAASDTADRLGLDPRETPDGVNAPVVEAPQTQPAPTPPSASTEDQIVAGNVNEVTNYISTNPGAAKAILDAENRRAAAENRKPREGIVRAAEAAAGFTQ